MIGRKLPAPSLPGEVKSWTVHQVFQPFWVLPNKRGFSLTCLRALAELDVLKALGTTEKKDGGLN